MERILYFDCFSGISGDMTLGALIDLGVDPSYLKLELEKLYISGYTLEIKSTEQNAIQGTDVIVHLTQDTQETHDHEHPHNHHCHEHHEHHHEHHENNHHEYYHEHLDNDHHNTDLKHHHEHENARNLYDIIEIINQSSIKVRAKEQAISIFTEIAKAEAKVHGKTLHEVHFHEVGATDSIVDIVGTAICLDYLNIDRICCSVIQDGHGFIECQHGRLPVPVPAVSQMLAESKLTLVSSDVQGELVTPTGFGILKATVSDCGTMPKMKVEKIGYGFGKKKTGKFNALRVYLGTASLNLNIPTDSNELNMYTNTVCVIETSLDDETGEVLSYTMDCLFNAGALDVYYTPIYMKKNRPGILLTVLCNEEDLQRMADILFRETSTIGLRYRKTERLTLSRNIEKIETPLGAIQIKKTAYEELNKCKPEFDDCVTLAKKHHLSLKEIQRQLESFLSKQI
ncbi:nickel pincer cofactor biosynthesis protein LarC [Anaerovorax sp. IOR16]|uniref:nickel pincer cofactor biosynthesis protein LarC n=1 Tax=Anaerovorax sp. IOR16 TaxID=2773458 RepID=UPI0019D0A3CA|nr:nickel pincer cofactor biosynthesis protein LarC [Anaerovorax sp. IOR16]